MRPRTVGVGSLVGSTSRTVGIAVACALAVVPACRAPQPPVEAPRGFEAGRAFPEAEAAFRRDPRWLGADAALSVPLDDARTLWLFGDSFVGLSDARSRADALMVRNTVAIQTGLDPLDAALRFHWGEGADGRPASFFAERGGHWYWPGHGVRLERGPLVVFLFKMTETPGRDLGFAAVGYALAVIDDPDGPAERWAPRVLDAPTPDFDALPATAVLRDGPHVVALATRQAGTHAGTLVRWSAAALAAGETGDAEWWAGVDRGWVAEADLGAGGPVFVIDDAGAECSIHRDERTRSFVHVASYGFGDTWIGVRTAPAPTGPWSAPREIYRPPESDGPRPFVYAAKAHPELRVPGTGELVVTYATNSFEFADLLTAEGQRSLYWPRLVRVRPVLRDGASRRQR